ncbi:hypothetical protein FRC01_007728 [Tulasnella sp. 417]|nr:hypothetical protein FRC01_007728 [Tulasnella sp. 417]
MISTSKLSILSAIAGTAVAMPISFSTNPSQHERRAADGEVQQRKSISTGGIIAIVVSIVVVVFIFGVAALLFSRRRRRKAKLSLTTTGAPVMNAPGPDYLPPMPERPGESPTTSTATTAAPVSQPRPKRQKPASAPLSMPPVMPPPSAARTSRLQRPPSPDAGIRFPAPKMPQPSFAGGFAISMSDRPGQASAASSYPAQPPMREPGFR